MGFPHPLAGPFSNTIDGKGDSHRQFSGNSFDSRTACRCEGPRGSRTYCVGLAGTCILTSLMSENPLLSRLCLFWGLLKKLGVRHGGSEYSQLEILRLKQWPLVWALNCSILIYPLYTLCVPLRVPRITLECRKAHIRGLYL